MKKGIIALLLLGSCSYAGSMFTSIDSTATCIPNEDEEGTFSCGAYEFAPSLYEFKSKVLFVHTTETITSSYFIQASEARDDGLALEVVSDVGNKYTFLIKEDVILIQKGDEYMIKMHVKRTF